MFASTPAAERVIASLRALGVVDTTKQSFSFDIVLEASAARAGWQQARRWTDTVPLSTPTRLAYLYDAKRARALYELHSPAPGDIWFKYLTQYDSSGVWQVDLLRWRLGDDIVRGTVAQSLAAIATLERHLPHVLLRRALRADTSLRATPPRSFDGRTLAGVTFFDVATKQSVTMEIDAASRLPVLMTVGPSSVEFRDYRTVDGIQVPFLRIQRTADVITGYQRVSVVNLRPAMNDQRFEMPRGYADPPAAKAAVATRVSGSLYRLDNMPGGYHSAFIVTDSGVNVFEAPQTPQFSDTAIRLIASVAPGKAIRYVFVTHHHNDHVGGLAPYVALGARIVVSSGLEEAIRRQLPDTLASRAQFVAVDGRRTFGIGESRIDAVLVPNEHAEGNVTYYVPSARAIFQGDLFYIPERGAVPPAFPVTNALARVVRTNGWAIDYVIGVHGRTGSWQEVEQSMALAATRSR